MIRAYDELYLDDAMDSLGSAMEYAISSNVDGQLFMDLFASDDLSESFARGSPTVVSGMSGIELAERILSERGIPRDEPGCMASGYPREYWVGWILAYYQWHSAKPFRTIFRKLRYDDLCDLYGTLHEADPTKAAEVFDGIMTSGETNLARARRIKGLSQSQLACSSGVSIRSIQLYEQRRTDIGRAQYNHLKALSLTLGCSVEDILD